MWPAVKQARNNDAFGVLFFVAALQRAMFKKKHVRWDVGKGEIV